MLSVLLGEQSDNLKHILKFYLPKGSKILDVTYGHGKIWSSISKDCYKVVTNDIDPESLAKYHHSFNNLELISKEYGKFDAILYDPPYKYGKSSYILNEVDDKDWRPIKTKWRVIDQVTSAQTLNIILPEILKPNGSLIVKIMDTRYQGNLIPNHMLLIQEFKNFRLKDIYIYIRLLVGLFKNLKTPQTAHGFYLIFKLL